MKNYLTPGNYNALCDSCGRKFKASQLRRRWDGLMVCSEDYEVRHPSDFLRVQKEKISVPWARPEPDEDTFISGDPLITEISDDVYGNYVYVLTENDLIMQTEDNYGN